MHWPCASLPGADLRERTTLRVGGPVAWLLEPADPEQFREAIVAARERGIPMRILGGGANVVIDDSGLEGVWSGAPLPKLCRAARDLGYSGLEKMAGVPGHVGGGIAMNAGGKDRDGTLWQMSDVVEQIRVVNAAGEMEDIARDNWDPVYRDGRLGDAIVAGAVLRFEPRSRVEVTEASREYLRRKNAVQPVTERSAGCVFKNPDPERSGGKTAGLLVDEAGGKGRRRGEATISERHGNFLINQGAASAADVFGLIEEVQDLVAQRTGLELECEVKLWRDDEERAAT